MTELNIEILPDHRPDLTSGTYTVSVTQSGEYKTPILPMAVSMQDVAGLEKTFVVSGPDNNLAPQEIVAVYPPQGAKGHFDRVIPHLALRNSMLPWMWSLDGMKSSPPWLALILFQDGEAHLLRDPSVGENSNGAKVLEVDAGRLSKLVPESGELHRLAHVRRRPDDEIAVLLCNRLPKENALNTVVLVSLRDFVRGTSGSLPCLKSWQFFCDKQSVGFSDVMGSLDRSALLRTVSCEQQSEAWLKELAKRHGQGYSAVRHLTHQGEDRVSWYRGALLPHTPPKVREIAPVAAASKLTVPDEVTRLDDMSYAAAWELGRLLALQDIQFTQDILEWRRACTRHRHRAVQSKQIGHLTCEAASTAPEFPQAFLERLARLEGVPLRYLVPVSMEPPVKSADTRQKGAGEGSLFSGLLPPESIRFFQVDPLWIHRMLQGALSIGSDSSTCKSMEELAQQRLAELSGVKANAPLYSGFILRSHAVSSWPQIDMAFSASNTPLGAVSGYPKRPSPEIVIGLAHGVFDSLTLSLPGHMLHHELPKGLDPDDQGKWLGCVAKSEPILLVSEILIEPMKVEFAVSN